MNFAGRHEHSLDDKGRIVLPREFRAVLGTQVTLQVGTDGCINVFPSDEWEKLADKVNALPVTSNRAARSFHRQFFSWSRNADIDGQGRLPIPPLFRERCALEREVVVIGSGSHLQIWDREALAAEDSATLPQLDEISQDFGI